MIMVQKLKEKCELYNDGLIGDRELLGAFVSIIGDVWEKTPETANDTAEANALVKLFIGEI